MNAVCGDNRFEIITKVKKHLIKATNIEMQPEELKYVDNILFRLWQLGYFDSVEKTSKLEEQVADLQSDHVYNLELMKGLNERIAKLNEEISELEKENTGLKTRLNAINLLTPELEKQSKVKKQRLTKAKEIIRDFLSVAIDYINKEDKNYSFIAEAEQFLNNEMEK